MSGSGPLETYLEGVTVRVAAVLTDFDNVPIPSGDVRLLVRPPSSQDSTIVTTTNTTDGVTGFITASEPGVWRYRFESIVPPIVASEGMFYVARRRVPPPA